MALANNNHIYWEYSYIFIQISKSSKDIHTVYFNLRVSQDQFRKTTQETTLISSMPDKLMSLLTLLCKIARAKKNLKFFLSHNKHILIMDSPFQRICAHPTLPYDLNSHRINLFISILSLQNIITWQVSELDKCFVSSVICKRPCFRCKIVSHTQNKDSKQRSPFP